MSLPEENIPDSPAAPSTVRTLRSRWKPHKQRLQEVLNGHPTTVRFHRTCSWMQAIEDRAQPPLDEVLVLRWIAFNALYAQWNSQLQQPAPDKECWQKFLEKVSLIDEAGLLAEMLQKNKPLVILLLEDPYLNRFFWKEPSRASAQKSRSTKHKAYSWFNEKRWDTLLDEMLERIYLLRCQMIHGAATHGSKLNRKSLKHCCLMLGHLLPTLLTIITDHGSDEDWGPMCYPPLDGKI